MTIAALYVQPNGCYYQADKRPRLSSKQASATPTAFRDVLLSIAKGVQ